MPPRGQCQCLHPGGCNPSLNPLRLEDDERDRCIFPLDAGLPRKPEYAGYTKVEVAVDSGAAASVMPEACLPDHPVRPNEGSANGVHYLSANGG